MFEMNPYLPSTDLDLVQPDYTFYDSIFANSPTLDFDFWNREVPEVGCIPEFPEPVSPNIVTLILEDTTIAYDSFVISNREPWYHEAEPFICRGILLHLAFQ